MSVYSIIQKSQLEGAKRIDAEYYQPEYLDNEKLIRGHQNYKVSDIASVVYGTTPKGGQFFDEGMPFIRSQNFILSLIDDSDLVYCSADFHKKNKKSSIKPSDILFAAVGATIGQLAVVQGRIKDGNINQNIARVRISSPDFNPYFLWSFFNSKIGQLQIRRLITGNAQPYLNSEQIKAFLIPKINDQRLFEKYFDQISQLLENSKLLYRQAENLLLEELGLKDFADDGGRLSNIINLSDIKIANRFDAEYFQSKYKKLEATLKNFGIKKFGEIIEDVPAKFNPISKPDETFRYIELANVDSSSGTIDGFMEVYGREAPSRAKRILKTGDVIVSSVGGSLEKVALVDDIQDRYLASTGFFQFRSKEILPEVLLIMAGSLVFQMQLEQRVAGTILAAVPQEAIKDLLIPILPQSTQKKIADLVRQSHEARKKAKELLEEAKMKVEDIIETKS